MSSVDSSWVFFSRGTNCSKMMEVRLIVSGWQYLCKSSFLKLCRCHEQTNRKIFTTFTYLDRNVYKSTNAKKARPISFRNLCTDKKDTFLNPHKNNVQEKVLRKVFEHNKVILRETEQRLRLRSSVILRDIKTTKDKVKEKMEEVIEVWKPLVVVTHVDNWRLFQRENIYTIPNFLCVSRMLISPYLGALIVQQNYNLALAVLGLAALTDLV